jgi:8-oxo-dGTP pyrophosphatase MutT (NUDIX family)
MSDLLDLDATRKAAEPKDAATIIVVREAAGNLEIFCVERHRGSRFLGGAVVFPGGKLDPLDQTHIWTELATEPLAWDRGDHDASDGSASTAARALGVCACRETLEEAALLLADGAVDDADVVALRERSITDPTAIAAFLSERSLRLALDQLIPFSRWVTPTAEARRYDTRFFLAPAPRGQKGAHDERETTASFWSSPRDLLALFAAEKIQLAPPTMRTLDILSNVRTVAEAESLANRAPLTPICPELVTLEEGSLALVLPGDPLHSNPRRILDGSTRYVKHGVRWLPR